jgi:hypothetical protein
MLQRIAQRVSSTLAGGAHTKIVINRHVALNLGSRAVGQRDNSQIKSEGMRFRKRKNMRWWWSKLNLVQVLGKFRNGL